MPGEDVIHDVLKIAIQAYQVRSHKIGTAVNIGDSKCDVDIEGEPTLHDVRFHAIEDAVGNKVVFKPKDNSKVIIGIISNLETEAFIEQCSEIDEVLIVTGTKQYKLNSEGHLIKGGEFTLKQVVQNIIEATQQIVVIYGNNPNYEQLATALEQLNSILQ